MKIILACVLVAIVVVVVLLFTPLGERPLSAIFRVGDVEPVDFEGIQLTDKPNQFLVCPSGLCNGHAESPVFDPELFSQTSLHFPEPGGRSS